MELKKGQLNVVLFDKKDIENYVNAGWKLVEPKVKEQPKEETTGKPKKSNKKVEVIEKENSEPVE